MNALVTDANGVLGASVIRALRWEGHEVIAIVSSWEQSAWLADDPGVVRLTTAQLTSSEYIAVLKPEDVVFDTTPGSIAVAAEGSFAQFAAGALIGPGEGQPSPLGRWINEYLESGRVRHAFGGARITDARDLALAMIAAADKRVRGNFALAGSYIEYEEILTQLEWLTGVPRRNGGSVDLMPESTELPGEYFGLPLRPLRETLADITGWHAARNMSPSWSPERRPQERLFA